MATILVVDDQVTNRQYLMTLLGYGGHRLHEAADGTEALQVARSEHPDLVIADILMPNIDGFEFVRQLRADPATSRMRVIFWTAAYLERESRVLATLCGVEHLIFKPAEPQTVLDAVATALSAPAAAPEVPPLDVFDRKHLRVTTDKLAQKVQELEALNLRLAALSRQYETILNAASDGIFEISTEGRVTFANPAAARMLGYDADKLLGMALGDLTHPLKAEGKPDSLEERPTLEGFKQDATRHGTDDLFWRSDGASFPVEYTSTPIQEGEAIVGQVVVFKDITEQVRTEAVRRRTEEQLEQMAAELTRSNADLEQFAYVASHDLQEPLREVAGMVHLLQKRYQSQLDGEADEIIGLAVEGVTRMQALIRDLLALARVGTHAHPFEPTDVAAALQTVLANLAVVLRESGAVVTHDALPTVMAEPSQLIQLLQNLIGNAVKFHGALTPEIHVGAEHLPGEWRLSVRDNGIGIEPQHFQRIFVVFQRLHTRREYPGTGIGLAVCKKIVERHGGRIWVESQPGQGSTFYFTLPDRKYSDVHPVRTDSASLT